MSLFQCENCGCMENTALSAQGTKMIKERFDWSAYPEREGMMLCSECAPHHFSDGTLSMLGTWHHRFTRVFLPKGEFETDQYGNLRHIKTGSTDYQKFKL